AHGDRTLETHRARHAAFDLLDLLVIAAREREEAGLRARRALHAAQRQPGGDATHFVEIEREILRPQAGALAHRDGLRDLEVRVAETRLRAPALRERRERGDHRDQALLDETQGAAIEDQVRVVGDEAARGTEVDDRSRLRAQV